MAGRDLPESDTDAIFRMLLRALESARNRLAVAIASESKAILPYRRQGYVEVDDRMRRCLRELRALRGSSQPGRIGWIRALEALRGIPCAAESPAHQGQAQQLCRRLQEVLAELEGEVE